MNYESQRQKWEELKATDPDRAYIIGPPNWLVTEQTKQGEEHLQAFSRIRAEIRKPVTRRETRNETRNAKRGPSATYETPAEKQRAYRERKKNGA